MCESLIINNRYGQYHICVRTHDTTGVDYRNIHKLTEKQAKRLAAGGEYFLFESKLDITGVKPARLSAGPLNEKGCAEVYIGTEVIRQFYTDVVGLINSRA